MHAPDLMPVTTNGAESCHRHLNADFNVPRPNIYIFVEALLRQIRLLTQTLQTIRPVSRLD